MVFIILIIVNMGKHNRLGFFQNCLEVLNSDVHKALFKKNNNKIQVGHLK